MVRRRRDPRRAMAMVGGVLLGGVLFANLGPGRVAEPAPKPNTAPPSAEPFAPVAAVPPAALPTPELVRGPAVVPTNPVPEPDEPGDTGLAPASLVIDVVDPDGRPVEGARVHAVDCPGFRRVEVGRYEASAGSCTLRAVRRDGLLFARSEPVTLALRSGAEEYAQLELINARTGGIGVRFRPTEVGMQVLHVMPGSAAWDAGLEPGDVIVEVDGEVATELPAEAFVEVMTGPEGTDVEFTVEFEGADGLGAETVRVTRRFLEG